jgi:hypothetical protein
LASCTSSTTQSPRSTPATLWIRLPFNRPRHCCSKPAGPVHSSFAGLHSGVLSSQGVLV